ncbi:unnamed protein product [Closterium sp. NIES-53]
MYGSSNRLFRVGELLDRLWRAAGDRYGVAVDQGARQLQLTGLGNGWTVDQEGQFNLTSKQRSTRGAWRQQLTVQVDGRGPSTKVLLDGSCGRPRAPGSAINFRRMHNDASRANRLRAPASVRTAVFYRATLDIHSAAALAHHRPAVLAGCLSAVLALLLYATLAGGRPCCALEVAGLKGFVDVTVPIPPVDNVELRGEFRAAHLLTFMVISRCCSPVVQLALRSCRERLDAGHQAWHFILSTYQVRDDLYIRQLEEKMTHIRMGEQESATDYCNCARQILAEMRMASAEYSTASYISHIVKGLLRGYNLMKRMMMVPGTRESLDKDSITSYILQDEAMQEAEQPTELLPQANYAAPTKLNQQQRQRRKPGGGGSGGGRSTKDVDEKRSSWDKGKKGGGRRRECWICHDPDHLSYECPDRDDSDEDDTKGGRGRSTSRRPRQDAKPHKEKHTSKKTLSTKDVDKSSGKSRGDGEASCSTVSLALKAGEDFRAVAEAVQANPMAVLLDSGCSHHLMGTKAVFVNMAPSDDVKHHEVATELNIKPSIGADPPCVSCVRGKLARHTFPDKGSNAKEALAVVHIDLCGPFRVAAKDGSLYFLLLKDCHTRFVWVMPVAKKSDVLREFHKWLVVERQTKKSVLMLRSDRGGEFLGKEFTNFVDGKGIVHDLSCPYTPQQNGMAEWEMRTAVDSVRTMLLHMSMQHHWWHLTLRQAVWVRNCLERSTTPPGTTPYQLLTGKKLDLTLARVWGCMVQFMVLEQQRGGKLAPKARWGLHLGVSMECKGWEVLDLTDNKVVTSVEVIFYETLSVEVWKAKFWPASGRTQADPATDTSTATGSLEASPVAPASGIAGGRQGAKLVDQDGKLSTIGEQQTGEPVEQEAAAGVQSTGEQQTRRSTGELSKSAGGEQLVAGSKELVDDLAVDEEGELSAGEESTDSDVVEVSITKPQQRRIGQARRPPERLSFHACLPPAAFTTVYDEVHVDLLYDDVEEDEELPELDPDVHADPEHRWDIATMTMKEVMASWKGEAVKAAMEEEIRSLIGMGTWELVERPRGVNIMKIWWVLMTKYRIDDTVEREKARLVVKGFMQMCGADYDETYSPVSSYVTQRIFLSILLKSLYGLKQSPLLWYMALDDVLLGAGWNKSQVDEALYFKASNNEVTCWVLVYVDDLLAASSSPAMLKELTELLEAAFKLRNISLIVKYLGLEIVRDRPARKLWLHQQGYADKLHMRFIDEEQGGRVPKTPVSVNAYAELTFDDEEAQEREEEDKLGSGFTVRSDQHWREVDRCLAYLADTRDTALEFGSGPELLELIDYVDADDAGVKQKRTSTSGYVFLYGGAAVSWSSSRIKCATLSSTESEYVAAMNAGKEGRRLRFLLAEFKLLDAGKPTILRGDNKSAITVAAGLGMTGNLKHMEQRYAWLQHMVRRGKFILKYIPTTEQPADFLTKALHFPAFNSGVLGPPSLGQRRRLGRMYGSSNRPFTVGELLDRLRQAGGDRCGVAVDQGARQLQLSGLGNACTVDQEGQFDREVDGAVQRPDK